MPDNRQHAEDPLAIGERRLHRREKGLIEKRDLAASPRKIIGRGCSGHAGTDEAMRISEE